PSDCVSCSVHAKQELARSRRRGTLSNERQSPWVGSSQTCSSNGSDRSSKQRWRSRLPDDSAWGQGSTTTWESGPWHSQSPRRNVRRMKTLERSAHKKTT